MKVSHPVIQLNFKGYKRRFKRPLKTAWGEWKTREGILVRIADPDTGRHAFGEAAPLPAFGSESLKEALSFLSKMPREIELGALDAKIASAPLATAFSLRAACEALTRDPGPVPTARTSAVLLIGDGLEEPRSRGATRFKVKMGVHDQDAEWRELQQLVLSLSPEEKLRLDPNQSWDKSDWGFWRPRLHGLASRIEFVEEPFPPTVGWKKLLEQARHAPVPFALDESLVRDGLASWTDRDWPGYYVIKPSLLGDPKGWWDRISTCRDRVVLSSVFETGIGLTALHALAQELGVPSTEHGFGTQAYFNDDLGLAQETPSWRPLAPEEQDQIWNQLS